MFFDLAAALLASAPSPEQPKPSGYYCSAVICNSCGHVYMEKPVSCDCGNDESINGFESAAVFVASDLDKAPEQDQAAPGSGWVLCDDRMPEIPKDAPAYAQEVRCLVTTESGAVVEAKYTVNAYAKTEKGRAPRWEWGGRICPWKVYAWMPLPEGLKRPNPPAEDEA